MTVEPIIITDKNGREVVIRNAEEKDAEALIQYLKITTAETPFLIREPDEVNLTLEQEKAFLKAQNESPGNLMLIAVVDGRHAGNCSLMSLGNYRRYRHRCSIAIALYQEYCGLGIGTAMLEILLDIAGKTGYEQAELEVIADNKAAIALYEKLGFRTYGTFPRNMKYADGRYADAFWMMKQLQTRYRSQL